MDVADAGLVVGADAIHLQSKHAIPSDPGVDGELDPISEREMTGAFRRFCQPLRQWVDWARCGPREGDYARYDARHVDRRLSASGLSGLRMAIAGTRCGDCGKQFNERSFSVLNRTQYPSDVIALLVLWRLRYKLSPRDLGEMFLTRGFVFSYEAVRD